MKKHTKHTKHTNLERRDNDNFAPNEISILGTNCNNISDLVHKISPKYNLTKITAEMENGLLNLHIPISEESKPKLIKIK